MRINLPSMYWLAFFIFSIVTVADPFEPIASWRVASSVGITEDVRELSTLGFDTSAWYKLDATRGTLMATLIANGIYNETDLFYSNNLQSVDSNQFRVPWYYRSQFTVRKDKNVTTYHTLRTNGISSRADIYVNGHLVADKNTQAGAYGGLEYDVSDKLHQNGTNVLLIKTYPTDYNRDFALGFVDWNPYPPDNGTGVWRDVELKSTGQVSLSSLRVDTSLNGSMTVHVDVRNLAKNVSATGYGICAIYEPEGDDWRQLSGEESPFEIVPGGQAKLKFQGIVENPRLWWPKQWGEQPLYSLTCHAVIEGPPASISDTTPSTRFGFRKVSTRLRSRHNDTRFFVNGEDFQVLGAGYTSDMFLRFDESKVRAQFQYVLDMGLNTVRLEGKQEHPRLYELADEMGIMLLAGWECCDKWEGWAYNDEGSGEKWADADYSIANLSMRHEAEMMQTHPSVLGFLIGSDFWPDDRATKIYVDALRAYDWDAPIISSASQRGAPALLGNGGMKMEGPYDWVPPNYWYDSKQRLGSAGGFGSELGAGVGTPPMSSLERFLSPSDLSDLWTEPHKGLYHMSTNVSSFYTRSIYNNALWARMGQPTDLNDYLMKAAMMDYEATKAQFEAYSTRVQYSVDRRATGLIYWMLNNAWPSLHWNLFDYYLQPGPAYFGTKAAIGMLQHVTYDYETKSVYLVDREGPQEQQVVDNGPSWKKQHAIDRKRMVAVEIMNLQGHLIVKRSINAEKGYYKVAEIPELRNATKVLLLRLVLQREETVLSRNTYWLSPTLDQLEWERSTWYHTPVSKFADLTALDNMEQAELRVFVSSFPNWTSSKEKEKRKVRLQNKSRVPAVFIRMILVDKNGRGITPVLWSENYMTLWPGEEMDVDLEFPPMGSQTLQLQVDGRNVAAQNITVGPIYW